MKRGVKAITAPSGEQYVALWTANAFEDRQEETFSTKSLQDYVARADLTGDRGRVWWWHVKGTDFADIVWQGVHGRFLLELAKPDKTDYGQKMFHNLQHPEEFPKLLPQGWGTSHGYLYLPGLKQFGVYGMMHKFETTVLPAHRASNIYGGIPLLLGGNKMSGKVTQAKKDGLEALVGEETAAMLLDMTDEATKALEDHGISWKEFADKAFPPKATKPVKKTGDEDEDEDEDEEDDAEDQNKGKKDDGDVFEMELGPELLKEIAEHVDVAGQVKEAVQASLKELLPGIFEAQQKSLMETVVKVTAASKEQLVKEAIAGTIKLVPHVGSKSDDNTLSQDVIDAIEGKKEKDHKEGDKAKSKDPVANVVDLMLTA